MSLTSSRSDSARIDLDSVPVAALLVLSLTALLWLALLEGWFPFPSSGAGIDAPTTEPGVPEALAVANGFSGVAAYLLVWGAMMLAMMLSTTVPAVRRLRRAECGPLRRSLAPMTAFLAAYGLVWTATGVVPVAVETIVSIREVATASWRPFVAGVALVAGVYQLTSLKLGSLRRCRGCRSVPHKPGTTDALRLGYRHGVECVRCTAPLFVLMVALGSMNPLVMAGLTLVVTLERLAPDGEAFAVSWGVILLAAAGMTVLGVGPFA